MSHKKWSPEGSKRKSSGEDGVPTLTAETARNLYKELVELARSDKFEEVREMLLSLRLADLSLLRRELGASSGKKKASSKTLTDVIVGRIREVWSFQSPRLLDGRYFGATSVI